MSKLTDLIYKRIEEKKCRSAWDRGVKEYALELVEELGEAIDGGYEEENLASPKLVEKMLLNGAQDWKQYSWGGCSLIYDRDIAGRLCNNTELKLTKGGNREPNKAEHWLDVQARALFQAAWLVRQVTREVVKEAQDEEV